MVSTIQPVNKALEFNFYNSWIVGILSNTVLFIHFDIFIRSNLQKYPYGQFCLWDTTFRLRITILSFMSFKEFYCKFFMYSVLCKKYERKVKLIMKKVVQYRLSEKRRVWTGLSAKLGEINICGPSLPVTHDVSNRNHSPFSKPPSGCWRPRNFHPSCGRHYDKVCKVE